MLSSFVLFPSFLLLTFPFTHLCSLPPSQSCFHLVFSYTVSQSYSLLLPNLSPAFTLSPCITTLVLFSPTLPSFLLHYFSLFFFYPPFSLSFLPPFHSFLPFSFSSPLFLSLSSPLFLLSFSSPFLLFFSPPTFLIFSPLSSLLVLLFSLSAFLHPSPFPYLLPSSFFLWHSLLPFSFSSPSPIPYLLPSFFFSVPFLLLVSHPFLIFSPLSSLLFSFPSLLLSFSSSFLLFSFFLSPFLIFFSLLFLPSYFPFSPTTPVYHYYSHNPRELLPTSVPQKVRNQMPKVFSRHR